MNWDKAITLILAGLFFFMLIAATGSHTLLRQAPLNGFGSASFLAITGGLVLVSAQTPDRARLLLIGLIGFLAEVIGVKYGWLFGRYSYTEVLAPNIFNVPLLMGGAWLILIGYVKQMLASLRLPHSGEVVLGGLWMTTIDLLLDPIAARPFNFWTWKETGFYYGIPLNNFMGWFVVSSIILVLDKWVFKSDWQDNHWVKIVGLGIIIFCTISAITYSFFVPFGIGILLTGTHFWLATRPKVSVEILAGNIKTTRMSE